MGHPMVASCCLNVILAFIFLTGLQVIRCRDRGNNEVVRPLVVRLTGVIRIILFLVESIIRRWRVVHQRLPDIILDLFEGIRSELDMHLSSVSQGSHNSSKTNKIHEHTRLAGFWTWHLGPTATSGELRSPITKCGFDCSGCGPSASRRTWHRMLNRTWRYGHNSSSYTGDLQHLLQSLELKCSS